MTAARHPHTAALNVALFTAPTLNDAHFPLRTLATPMPTPTHQVTLVSHGSLQPSALNPRRDFEATSLQNLALSIYAHTISAGRHVQETGVLMPLIVRQTPEGTFEIAAGERRYRAVQLLIDGFDIEVAGQPVHFQVPASYPMPVQIRDLTDAQLRDIALAENVHREDLNELEEADLFVACRNEGLTPDEIAVRYGSSRATVERRLTLGFGLGRDGRRLFEEKRITLEQAHILSLVSGPLKQTLLRAAKQGTSVAEMQALVSRSAVLVEHAVFDVAASGLTVVQSLYVDLPDRFSDARAALACQLDELNARADRHRAATGEWAEVLGVDTDPQVLPDGYVAGAQGPKGTLYAYSLATGQMHEHAGVCRREDLVELTAATDAAPRPVQAPTRDSADVARRPSAPPLLRENVLMQVETARTTTLVTALMNHPQAGLVNVIMQTLSRGGNIQIEGLTGAQRKSVPAVQAYAENLVAQHAELFESHTAGCVSLRRDVTPAQAFQALLAWPVAELLPLLTFLTCGSAYEAGSAYTRAVAESTGADRALAFPLTPDIVQGHSMAAMEQLIDAMPESLRPITMERTSTKEYRALLLDRAERLSKAGWVPPYARY